MADSGNIKVVVRCRPMNSREKTRGASNLIEFKDEHQLVLQPPSEGDSRENARATKKKHMPFSFDRAYDENTEQRELFEYVGLELLEHSFNGFNTCVFAYGQTGSGKSHSMVGYAEAKGLIPLTCSRLFDDASEKMDADPNLRITVEVSYIEIYNEKVRDLLNPKNKGNLRVREHPSLGPYVEDLSKLVVKDFNDIEHLMDEGNKARTVAATNMNETSSRSHAVFTLVVTQKKKDEETKLEAEKVSRISLVDLAGSERANSTGATGSRLKEGANINRSLTTLGKVIAALATASSEPAKTKKKAALENFVPYRDSVLTWLLKDSLGGNSKTAMIAAISPADYEETLSTLRYADQAKKIKNKAVVNEDPNARLIRELKEELEMLRTRVSGGGGMGGEEGESTWDPSAPPEKQVVRYLTKTGEVRTVTKAELQDQMEQSEKLMSSLNQSWEEKVAQTQAIQQEREKALEELGISVDKANVGVHAPRRLPHLVNLNEDPLMSECLIYQLKPGTTTAGNFEGEGADGGNVARILLSGSTILPEHCTFENVDGVVTIHASKSESMTMVNGKKISADEPKRLRSGYRIILGEDFRHVFRFNHPEEVRRARDKVRMASTMGDDTVVGDETSRPDSPTGSDPNEGDVDWSYARREAAMARLNGQDVNFDALNEDDLEKLYEDITRARSKKVGANWRPDSRLSSFDDNGSETAGSELLRPYSMSAYTDDTSIDPWSFNLLSERGSPRLNGGLMRDEGASNIGTPEPEVVSQETLDLKLKVKEYEERFTKLANNPDVNRLDLPANYSDEQKRLLQMSLERWRRHTRVSMAEDVLSNAVLIKEANVISKDLGKQTCYQFTVVDDGPLANPTSSVEAIAGLTEFDDVADAELASTPKPCIGVKVMDHLHGTAYVWSLAKLEQRLQKMRNLYTFIDRPEYSQHFNWADPFYEDPSPTYTFVGNCLVPLCPLSHQVSSTYRLPIVSRHTGCELGTCRVEVKFVSLAKATQGVNGRSSAQASGASSPALSQGATNDISDLPIGHKLGFQLSVDYVEGLSADEYERVHVQVRLSSLAGCSITKDDVFASVPAETKAGSSKLVDVKMKRTITFVLTKDIIAHLRSGFAPIEFHAKIKDRYLLGLEKFDAEQEAHRSMGKSPASLNVAGSSATGEARPTMHVKSSSAGRLSEKEMVNEERHDILASVQMCELDASGDYKPVAVRAQSALDPGAFFLRQGLQRKLVLNLSHDSGRQFSWTKVSRLELGQVRLLDPKGKIHVSTLGDSVPLKVPSKQQSVTYSANGTSQLSLWAWWDSSVHDSTFLNRATASSHRVLLRLGFWIDVESCSGPVHFEMDVAVAINGRDAKPPGKLISFLESAASGSRTLSKTSAIFAVRLVPPMTKATRELWRLDTAAKYVPGEESLRNLWRPRGVSLVHDHANLIRREKRRAEVEGVRALLQARPPLSISNGKSNGSHQRNGVGSIVVERALAFWQAAYEDTKKPTVLSKEMNPEPEDGEESERGGLKEQNGNSLLAPSPLPDSAAKKKSGNEKDASINGSAPPPKLTAQVSLVPRVDTAAKRGWLAMPLEAYTDHWVRRWFVLRRPYLYVYESSSELDEIMAMNLSSVRVETNDRNVEQLLDRKFVMALYTTANSYFLQAPSQQEVESWARCLDSFHTARR